MKKKWSVDPKNMPCSGKIPRGNAQHWDIVSGFDPKETLFRNPGRKSKEGERQHLAGLTLGRICHIWGWRCCLVVNHLPSRHEAWVQSPAPLKGSKTKLSHMWTTENWEALSPLENETGKQNPKNSRLTDKKLRGREMTMKTVDTDPI